MMPKPFILCIDRFDAKGGKVWAVKTGARWFTAHTVHVWVDVETVFKGARAREPRAYLEGIGIVRSYGHGTITIADD